MTSTVDSFAALGLSDSLLKTLSEIGYETPSPIQAQCIPVMLDGHDIIGMAQTGTGVAHCPISNMKLSSGVARTGEMAGEDGVGASAEAVKAAIRTLIEAEPASAILSDDALVDLLRAQGFDLARRTVAKYREAMGIGSSVQRRRARKLAAL